MSSEYCTAADLYGYGLPRGSLPNPGRLVTAADASGNLLELDSHGFALDDELGVRIEDGVAGSALPGGLAAGTKYYAIPVSESTFRVAAAPGGAAIDLTSAGSNFFVRAPLPIANAIRAGASRINDILPAHVVPLTEPYPESVVRMNALLAVEYLLHYTGGGNPGLADMIADQKADMLRWAKGVPIRGDVVPPAANLAVSARGLGDPRGWTPDHGGLS